MRSLPPAPPLALVASLVTTLVLGGWFAAAAAHALRSEAGMLPVVRERLTAMAEPAWPELADAFRRGNPPDVLKPPAGDPAPVLALMLDRPYVTAAFHVTPDLRLTWQARGEAPHAADLKTWRPAGLGLAPWVAAEAAVKPVPRAIYIPGVPPPESWYDHRRLPTLGGPAGQAAARDAGILALVLGDAMRRDAGHGAFAPLRVATGVRVHAKGDRNHGWIGYATTLVGEEGAEILRRHGVGDLLMIAPASRDPHHLAAMVGRPLQARPGVLPDAMGDLVLFPHGPGIPNFTLGIFIEVLRNLTLLMIATGVSLLVSLRQLRRMMRHQALADARGRFVSGMSHEMRTPLTTIKLYAEMLQHQVVPEGARGGYLATIARECDRLTRLVENVLAYAALESRVRVLILGDVDAREAIDEAVEAARGPLEAAGLQVEVHAPVPLRLAADRDALVLAIANLLTNAAKYAAAGRLVVVSAMPAEDARDEAVIAVRDFGPGIPAAERQRVFEPFYRRRGDERLPGTGLGLALVQETARRHGGRAEVAGAPGEGAELRLRLPLAAPGDADA